MKVYLVANESIQIWSIFEDLLRRYNRTVHHCEGDVFGLFRHVWNLLCDVPIGPTYFGIKSELLHTGTPVVECGLI